MKRMVVALIVLAGLVFGASLAFAGAAAPKRATVTIRHQTHGCNTWSVNGGPYKASQVVRLARGGTLTVINNDTNSIRLVHKGGPGVQLIRPNMNRPGARATVVFSKPGTHRFVGKAGEEFVTGVKTHGEEFTLRLTVVVG